MKIKRVRIQNFRSIQDQIIECDNQTILIGANGAGKSTVLKAMQAFFEIGFKPKIEDYFAQNSEEPIELTITFHHFSDEEKDTFGARIHDNEMMVSRSFGGRYNEAGTYHGLMSGAPEFQAVRTAKNTSDKKTEYNKLIEEGYTLPTYTNKEAIDSALSDWEAQNPTNCSRIKDDGQFLGFKHVGGGKLLNATNFILIEAVRDAVQDANDQKNSAVGQLMDLIVRSAMQQNSKINTYQEEVNQKYAELTKPANFPELGSLQDALTESLRTYYEDVGVKLKWQESEGVILPPPKAAIKFNEESLEYPVERAGNGVQRAFIIALLHQLLVAKSNRADEAPNVANDNPSQSEEVTDGTVGENVIKKLPSVILAIEEPELYQHPTKQLHFSNVLRKLSSGALLNTFGDVQVIFCTHSPNFVDLSEFHNVRIAMKEKLGDGEVKHTKIKSASLGEVSTLIQVANQLDPALCNDETTKARLHIFGTELSEGFFADGVILVEGISDKAAIETVADLTNNNLSQKNIAVLCVNGKPNMDRPWMIFTQLGIPVYPIWDADSACKTDEKQNHIKTNKVLQRMLGVQDSMIKDFPEGVYETYACFKEDINKEISSHYGDEYNSVFEQSLNKFGFSADKGKKNPYVVSENLRSFYKDKKKIQVLEHIIASAVLHIKGDRQGCISVATDANAA